MSAPALPSKSISAQEPPQGPQHSRPSDEPTPPWFVRMRRGAAKLERMGNLLVDVFHLLALFVIGAAIAWSAFDNFWDMWRYGRASVEDILLLFIYLELGAMVGIYFKTNHMPVRFLLYVAVTALTHQMILLVQSHRGDGLQVLLIALSMLVLAVSILVIRFGSAKFPVARNSTEAFELRGVATPSAPAASRVMAATAPPATGSGPASA